LSVLRYPLNPVSPDTADEQYPSDAVDYVMFERFRIDYNDEAGGYKGLNVPNSNVAKIPNKSRVYIAMPKAVQTAYQASYSKVDMGVGGVMAATLAGDALGSGGMTFDKAASTIQQTAAAALPSAAGKTIADVTSSLNNLAGSGGAVSADALGAVALGKVFNPFSEQIFNSMGFRSHNFSFKLFARSKKEAQMIRKIVTYLKTGTAPRIAGGSGLDMFKFQSDDPEKNASDAEAQAEAQAQIDATVGSAVTSARFFEVPDKYSIKFVRMNPSAEGGGRLISSNLHFRVEDSVCTNMAVNYTPDGQYTSFKDITGINGAISVPVLQIDMSFTETKLLSQADLIAGF
tara:strand:- start:934 stop:1968 length:1035 start_codon:yes stop_codon:yes gene_type:complete